MQESHLESRVLGALEQTKQNRTLEQTKQGLQASGANPAQDASILFLALPAPSCPKNLHETPLGLANVVWRPRHAIVEVSAHGTIRTSHQLHSGAAEDMISSDLYITSSVFLGAAAWLSRDVVIVVCHLLSSLPLCWLRARVVIV
jgi:hypothetical protein